MKLIRFTKTERMLHWSFAVPVILLSFTGLTMIAMSFPGLTDITVKSAVLSLHVIAGLGLLILPAAVFLAGDRKIILANLSDILSVNGGDRDWLKASVRNFFKKGVVLPECGKFNAGQKLNTVISMTLVFFLCISGLSMLIIKGGLLSNIIHVSLSFMFLSLLSGHLYLALINPSTRHALHAITDGRVDAHWLREHHGRMYREIAACIHEKIIFEKTEGAADLKVIYERADRTDNEE